MRGRMAGMIGDQAQLIRLLIISVTTAVSVTAIAALITHLRKTRGQFSLKMMFLVATGVLIYSAIFGLLLRSLPASK
jgi:hypothetical protein